MEKNKRQKEVFLIWETDAWLSYSNRELMGIYADIEGAKTKILRQFKKRDRDNVRQMLDNIEQTQGFEYNYCIERAELNCFYY